MNFFDKLRKTIFTPVILNYFIVFCAAVLGIYLEWDFYNVLLFGLIIWMILDSWSSVRIGKAAFILIILMSIASIFHRKIQANDFAVATFYFLALAAFKAIYETMSARKSDKGS